MCQDLPKDLLKARLKGRLRRVLIRSKIPIDFETNCQAISVLKMPAFGRRFRQSFFKLLFFRPQETVDIKKSRLLLELFKPPFSLFLGKPDRLSCLLPFRRGVVVLKLY